MTRRWWMAVALVLAANGCGDGKNSKADGEDAGGDSSDGGDSGGSNGATTGETTGAKKRVLSEHSPNCEDDDPATPGTECKGMVTCGGTLEEPKLCPLDTHSCCTSNLPSEETVNCFEGPNVCKPIESAAPCDGPEDCPGVKICCVTPLSLGKPTTVCRELDQCDTSSEGSIFCHTTDNCPSGKECVPSPTAPFWGFCN